MRPQRPVYRMTTYTPPAESPFSEAEEQELAAELLGVTRDAELEHFLGRLLRRAASAVGTPLHHPVAQALARLAKGAVRRILPGVGRSLQSAVARAST